MKALLLAHDFPPVLSGGISTYYHHLASCLEGRISVLAPDGPGCAEFDARQTFGVQRLCVPLVPTGYMRRRRFEILRWPRRAHIVLTQWVRYYKHAAHLIAAEGADVLLLGHLYLGPLGKRLRGASGVPFGIMLHGSELHRYMNLPAVRRGALRALDAADFLVVNSEFTRGQYRELGVRASQRFVIVSPGVDTTLFRPDAGEPAAVRQRFGLGDRPLLLSVARLVEWKGQDVVLRALPEIRRQVPDVVYMIIGDGPYRAELERLVGRLGMAEHVVFAGFVAESELPSYYRAANLVAVPSREFRDGLPVEGFGIVYVEAGACGVPVIGGEGGGTADSIVDGETGYRVDPNDPAAVSEAVIRLLVDPQLAERMGRAGRERAVERFDWAIQADRLSRLLDTVTHAAHE